MAYMYDRSENFGCPTCRVYTWVFALRPDRLQLVRSFLTIAACRAQRTLPPSRNRSSFRAFFSSALTRSSAYALVFV
jgi:hypothetical protein